MPPKDPGSPRKRRSTARDGGHRLIRYSHIFASAVREILETKLLKETTSLPLTLSQFHLLKVMSFNGHHQVGELADFLGVSPPAATKNIDKLERYKLVLRSPSPGDRRATSLSVSARGRRLVQKYEGMKESRLSPILESFEPEEIDQLTSLLERFSVALLHHERSGRGFCLRCAAYIEENCPVGQIRGGCPYKDLRKHTSRGSRESGEPMTGATPSRRPR